jgi:XTP/dITP diphosphohydrolase
MKLVFATNNPHKLYEVRQLISDDLDLVGLKDINCIEEIPEEQDTIEGNASQKAFYIFNNYGLNCFADDTGLEIDGIDGRPGVYSARYAGEDCSFQDNIHKVLREMEGMENRNAKFRTVISLVINGQETQFEGSVHGVILNKGRGESGFGYDPIFQPDGFGESFAEMSLEQKNQISHRGKATGKLCDYLDKLIVG